MLVSSILPAFQGQPFPNEESFLEATFYLGLGFAVILGINILICAILYSAARRLPEQFQLLSPDSSGCC